MQPHDRGDSANLIFHYLVPQYFFLKVPGNPQPKAAHSPVNDRSNALIRTPCHSLRGNLLLRDNDERCPKDQRMLNDLGSDAITGDT